MNRLFIAALAVISIMFAFVGCNQSEPENNQGSNNQPPTPPSAQPGTKISASSLADLQAKIEGSTDPILDLSQCSNLGEGTLTINKAITIKNFDSASTSIDVTSSNVTLTEFKVNSVTTQQAGSSSLKIANSSLASLTLSGDGVARSDGRAETKPKSLIFDTIVTGEVCFNESVELDIATINGLNIGSFTGDATATINMTESAYEEYQIKYPSGNSNISANDNITNEIAYSYLNEFGYAGSNLLLKSKKFPSNCVGYISKLLKKYKKDAPNIPSLSLTSTGDFFQYYWNAYSQDMSVAKTDGAVLMVTIPSDAGFNKDSYESTLENAGFELGREGLAYTNLYEIEDMFDNMDESNYLEIMQTINNMIVYYVNIDIIRNDDNDNNEYYSIEYSFYAMKYGDLYGSQFNIPYGY